MPFFLMFIVLFIASYLYIGLRIINPFRLSRGWTIFLWMIVTGCILLPFLQILSMFRGVGGQLSRLISWSAYGTLGFLSLLLFPAIFRDVVYLVWLLIRKHVFGSPVAISVRNRFVRGTNIAILILVAFLMCYGFYEAFRLPRVREVRLTVDDLPEQFEGFRIVQITDIHIGSVLTGSFLDKVVERINTLDADVIVVTGDLVDGRVAELGEDVASLSLLRAPHGAYFTTGNHEYYSGAEEWVEEIRRIGLDVLMNEHRMVDIDGAALVIAGITDFSAGNHLPVHRSDPSRALRGAPPSAPSILFAHQPRSIFSAAEAGYDVMISGHTHGGQFYPWNLFVPLQQPYTSGLHLHGDTWIYVSNGTGFWGPPLRIGMPSEITEFILTADALTENEQGR